MGELTLGRVGGGGAQIVTGTFMGDDTQSHTVTGMKFKPDFFQITGFEGLCYLDIYHELYFRGRIDNPSYTDKRDFKYSLHQDGFTITTTATHTVSRFYGNVLYEWIAWKT